MSALFISDLHLHSKRPHITEAFFTFLNQQAAQYNELYILGDLFDAWIGDDDDTPLAASVASQLKTLSDTGTAIYFQHGNRDFILGSEYAKRCGMSLLSELHVIDINQQRWLLAHGDQFCTADIEYQKIRSLLRDPNWQKEVLKKTLAEREMMAKALREKSREANSLKAEDIMDVTPAEITNVLQENNCVGLIHGHTHRPHTHSLTLDDGSPAARIVLGDWDSQLWFVKKDKISLQLLSEAITLTENFT